MRFMLELAPTGRSVTRDVVAIDAEARYLKSFFTHIGAKDLDLCVQAAFS